MCSTNSECARGACCDATPGAPTLGTCASQTARCYADDGLRNVFEACSASAQCATRCCDRFWRKCIAHAASCLPDRPLPDWALGLLVAGAVLALLLLGVLGVRCCLRRRRARLLRVSSSSQQPRRKKPQAPVPKRSDTDMKLHSLQAQETYPTEYFYQARGPRLTRSKSSLSPAAPTPPNPSPERMASVVRNDSFRPVRTRTSKLPLRKLDG